MMFPAHRRILGSAIRRALQMRWSPLTLRPFWWFDMAEISGLTFGDPTYTATTTVWKDKSGNGYNTTLSSSTANYPFRHATEPGDLLYSNHAHMPSTALPSTMPISVFTVASLGGVNYRALVGGAAGSMEIRADNTQNISVLRANQANIITSTGTVTLGRRFIVGVVLDSAGSILSLNGVEQSNGTNAAISATTTTIGRCPVNSEYWENGYLHELLAWSGRALTKAERDMMVGYLAWKWRIVELAGNQPYRMRPPMMRPGWNNRRRLDLYVNVPAAGGGGGGARRRTSIVSSF